MKADHGATPIPIPSIVDDPRWIGRFSREVRKSIAALRDRKVIVRGRQGRGGGGEIKPLTIKQGTTGTKFQIIPGYVNMEMPTLATVALDNDPPPEITAGTADKYVWIKVVGSFGTGTGGADEYTVTIETTTTSSPPSGTAISSTGFTSFRSIGVVYYTAASGGDPESWDIVNFHNGGNLAVESFGNVNLWWLA